MTDQTLLQIPVGLIHANEDFNCRGKLLATDVIDLARDMGERGLLQPILLTPYSDENALKYGFKYQLIAGFRRFTAATKILTWPTVPAIIREGLSDADVIAMNLSENLQRSDLNIMQEAKALKHLIDLGYTEEAVAAKVSMSRGWVQIRCMLLKMPKEVQDIAAAGFVNSAQIRELYQLRHNTVDQIEAARKLKEHKQKGDMRKPEITVRKIDVNRAARRTPGEINQLMDFIFENVKGSIATRALAWCNGACSTQEFLVDLHGHYKGMVTEEYPYGQILPISEFENYAADRKDRSLSARLDGSSESV